MASKLQKGKLTVVFHAEKLEALRYCMQEKNIDLEEVTAEFINGLYEKHVPKIMKGFSCFRIGSGHGRKKRNWGSS